MIAPAVFAFGLVAFGFLAWARDHRRRSMAPLRTTRIRLRIFAHRASPHIKQELKKGLQHRRQFRARQGNAGTNDGAGNTFKATAKPVLIGTASRGATTMIFSIIMALTKG